MTAEDDPAGPPRWHRMIAVTAVNIAAGLAAGWVVFVLSRPSQDELQRAALDEIGLPVELALAPRRALLDAIAAHDAAAAEAELERHLGWHESFDFEGAIAARNAARR